MELSAFGWRDFLLLLVAAAGVYLAVLLLRLAGLRRRRLRPAVTPGVNEPALNETPPFAGQLAISALEAELQSVRAELSQLRQEVAALRTAPRISPLYADAVALARRGFDAPGIAAECGISVAEAELVLAMSRDHGGIDDEGDDGGNRNLADTR